MSSSGHLIVVPVVFGFEPGGIAFDTMVHLATFVAVVTVFWKDVWRMVRAVVGLEQDAAYRQLAWMLVVATVPIVLVGLLFDGMIERVLRAPWIVAASLIGWGVVLAAADLWQRRRSARVEAVELVGWKRSVLIGLAQVLALIPGTSRSGITMTAGLFAGLDRKTAARFSFLLSIPAVGGAAVYVTGQAVAAGESLFTVPMLVGFVAALGSGVLAIRVLLKLLERWSFVPYALYRIALGLLIISLL